MFGFLRGFLVLFLIYLPFNFLINPEKFPDWAKDSYSVAAFGKTYNWLNEEYKLSEKIEDDGEGVKIKFDKIDPEKALEVGKEKLEDGVRDAKESLKEAIEKEEHEKGDTKASDKDEENTSSDDAADVVDPYNEKREE